jgi:transposase
MTMLGLAVAGRLAGLLLPWLVRCPVCGVRIEDCSLARSRSGLPRSEWMDSLQACPVCGDDGNADIVAVRAWQASGREARESGSADPRAGKA